MTTPGGRPSRRDLLRVGAGALLAGLAGCTGVGSGGAGGGETTADGVGGEMGDGTADGGTDDGMDGDTATAAPDWRTVPLTDVLTDESFTLQEFAGRPVLLESFAVWCPTCTRQQEILRDVRGRVGDVVLVSLDVDPNEDAETVREHATEKGFDWLYAVSPPRMTRALVDEFGTVVTNPPSAPVIRVCPDGGASLLAGRGAKSADDVVAALDGC